MSFKCKTRPLVLIPEFEGMVSTVVDGSTAASGLCKKHHEKMANARGMIDVVGLCVPCNANGKLCTTQGWMRLWVFRHCWDGLGMFLPSLGICCHRSSFDMLTLPILFTSLLSQPRLCIQIPAGFQWNLEKGTVREKCESLKHQNALSSPYVRS